MVSILDLDRLSVERRGGFPGGSDGKESTCSVGDLGSIPELGRSTGGGRGSPLQYSCLENPHGQRSVEGYSPRGHKELDLTERVSTAQHSAEKERGGRKEGGKQAAGQILIIRFILCLFGSKCSTKFWHSL